MGRAMLGMLAVFAELQRAEIRERTKAKLRDKKTRGEATGRAAFGLVRSGAGFDRDPETWPTVAASCGSAAAVPRAKPSRIA